MLIDFSFRQEWAKLATGCLAFTFVVAITTEVAVEVATMTEVAAAAVATMTEVAAEVATMTEVAAEAVNTQTLPRRWWLETLYFKMEVSLGEEAEVMGEEVAEAMEMEVEATVVAEEAMEAVEGVDMVEVEDREVDMVDAEAGLIREEVVTAEAGDGEASMTTEEGAEVATAAAAAEEAVTRVTAAEPIGEPVGPVATTPPTTREIEDSLDLNCLTFIYFCNFHRYSLLQYLLWS